ncbi:MAG TPA: hypothetical protein VFX82_08260, partial [Desulfobacterales bacterium]|nr:hypothetical protein [Desulfobacterales bacterium]
NSVSSPYRTTSFSVPIGNRLYAYATLLHIAELVKLFLNRECERILKKIAFLTVEDSLQLAAGIFNACSDDLKNSAAGAMGGLTGWREAGLRS